MSGHADRIVVRGLVARRAMQSGDAVPVRAATHGRLVEPTVRALEGAIAGRVAVHTPGMLQDLACLYEERLGALAGVGDALEGARRPERRVLTRHRGIGDQPRREAECRQYVTGGSLPNRHRFLLRQAVSRAKGKRRTRRPVRWNRALATAGAIGGTPGSPTPVGAAADGTMWTSTAGICSMRSGRWSWKFDCWTRPSTRLISLQSAAPRPKPRPPSICARMTSGLIAMPQ